MKKIKLYFKLISYIVIFVVILFCAWSLENLYINSDVGSSTNFKKIAKQIKKNEKRPPQLKYGSPWEQGRDVSKYFVSAIKKGDDIFIIKDKLSKDGYLIDWRDKNGDKIESNKQKAVQLNALFVSYTGPLRMRDTCILLGIFFDDNNKVIEIKTHYVTCY